MCTLGPWWVFHEGKQSRKMRSDVLFLLLTIRTISHSIGSLPTTTKTKMMLVVSLLLVWDMKQRLVAVAAGKEGLAQE
jgi:hypothetical membrane protein